jgi:hypothetical protein
MHDRGETKRVAERLKREMLVKSILSLAVAVALAAGVVTIMAPVSGHADGEAKPVFVTTIPPGYRDWQFISLAHEEGSLNSFAAILGNDVAIKAYREGTLPFPDGAIIAVLHFCHSSSEENNKVFGRSQSFAAGSPTNIQFMVKDWTTPRPAGGGSVTSTTANLPTRHS